MAVPRVWQYFVTGPGGPFSPLGPSMWLEAGSFKKSLMNGSRNNCFFPPALFCYGLLFLWRGEREDRSSECVGFFLFSEGARERLEAEEWPALDPTVVTTGSGE